MWVKTTYCNMSLSSFKLETPFTMVLYWCSPLPIRKLQPAESYNSLSRFPVTPGRELQPPTSFQGPLFINFETGSIYIK